MRFWFLVFFATPIVEMYLLIQVGGYIGALPTIALVVLTAVAGVALLRVQGLATLGRGLGKLQGGQLPAQEVVEGLLLAFAGALLITPGFVTDLIGFLLLIPASRVAVARRLMSRAFLVNVVRRARPGTPPHDGNGPVIIEGDFESRADEAGPDRRAPDHPHGLESVPGEGDDRPPR
jgi:UPF0716 protein FxsA